MIIRAILIDILQAWHQYGQFALLISAFLLVVFVVGYARIMKRNVRELIRKNWQHIFSQYVLITYGIMIIAITILSRPEGSRVGMSLRPFATISRQVDGLVYPVENILLFIPLGILVPMIWRSMQSIPRIIVTGFLISLLIESVQLITQRGFFQTDDILLNVIGTLLGAFIFRFSSILFKRMNTDVTKWFS